MIEVKSYLMGADGKFHPVDQVSTYDGDRDYVEGAIELTINHVPIIDCDMYDYVDQLWAYLVRLIGEASTSGRSETLFPDQPIRLTLENGRNGRMLVTCDAGDGRRVAYCFRKELSAAIKEEATRFFQWMSQLIPENSRGYAYALRDAAAIQA
ncbi:hypothetical protein LIX60_03865 [Streptomyces sp. S07_1.15]|uniref:hypothetical protein n=1 Tax=Streptomyces sp. S07_1.15 TaxID=2873925 RepID=UPI001D155387|nr:hypothetical protein [Streptomyces sp. S07_1.15]MCC3650640.1 hypothetical protein [Streptomyces sp. S07_1.15]